MKTFNGVRRLIADLKVATIDNEQDYFAYKRRVTSAFDLLNCLFSNPADREEAGVLKCELGEALYRAQNPKTETAK